MSVYKKRPTLLDLLDRRGMTLPKWCAEHDVKSIDDLDAKCREMNVLAPEGADRKIVETLLFGLVPPADPVREAVVETIKVKEPYVDWPEVDPDTVLKPQTCTREQGHEGPCNGFPSEACKVFDPATETVSTAGELVKRSKSRKKSDQQES